MNAPNAVPVPVPVASSSRPVERAQNAASGPIRAATTTPLRRAPSPRAGRRGLATIRAGLSVRDLALLRSVAAHRYLTTRQIEGFHFADHATPLTGARVARRVLRRLHELRVLAHLEGRVGGVRAGSASYVWRVGPIGDRLLRDSLGGTRRRQREPGRLFLDHCLAVAHAHLALVAADRAGRLELLEVQTEPDCWRSFTGLGGERLVLQPDLYIVTGDPTEPAYVNHWFCEIDRGTESLPRLLRKSAHYSAYRRSGREQQARGSFPLVLWIMRDEEKAERLQTAIRRRDDLDSALFRTTTPEVWAALVAGGLT